MIYPQDGRISVTVTNNDLGTLRDEQFLNDVIIDFYLRYIEHDIITDPEIRKRIHIFNTFFYTKLVANTNTDLLPPPSGTGRGRGRGGRGRGRAKARAFASTDAGYGGIDGAPGQGGAGGESSLLPGLPADFNPQDYGLNEESLRRYANVAKWTRGVDLFSKDFVFVPINLEYYFASFLFIQHFI